MALRDADAEELPRWASAGDDEVVARLLDAGFPLDARGIDDGTPLHYAGLWGRASTVELLLARGAEPELMGGPREFPGTALAWTAWGSRALPGAEERLEGYLGAAAALLEAGARVGEGMAGAPPTRWPCCSRRRPSAPAPCATRGSPTRGRPVRVSVRRRARYDTTTWARRSVRRRGGLVEAAERAVEALGWNVSREGVVFVHAGEGRDIDALVRRTGEASMAVLEAVLALEE